MGLAEALAGLWGRGSRLASEEQVERIVVLGRGFAGFSSAVDAYLPVAAESDSGSARLSLPICISAEAVLGEVKHARHPF